MSLYDLTQYILSLPFESHDPEKLEELIEIMIISSTDRFRIAFRGEGVTVIQHVDLSPVLFEQPPFRIFVDPYEICITRETYQLAQSTKCIGAMVLIKPEFVENIMP
jgi:hypothetical protein